MIRAVVCAVAIVATARIAIGAAQDQPKPEVMDTPTIKVLKGLTVPEFDDEMKRMVAALGVNCGFCHVRNDFASDANEHKLVARRMLEMTKQIDQQFFPEFKPGYDESRLGKVTCFTCHQGELKPRTSLTSGE